LESTPERKTSVERHEHQKEIGPAGGVGGGGVAGGKVRLGGSGEEDGKWYIKPPIGHMLGGGGSLSQQRARKRAGKGTKRKGN